MHKWLAAISCCFCLSASAQQTSVPEPQALKKAYQQALYAYYQGDFFLALTQLAILEEKYPNGLSKIPDQLVGNQMEPELLKGGISLSYGLDNQAADIFSRLLATTANPETQSYAWLLLGKTYFQNRQFEKAAQAFAQIESQNAEEYFDQLVLDNWVYMQSQLYGVLSEQSTSAPDWLAQLSRDSIYRQYVSYNQALALLQNEQTPEGIKQLHTVAQQQTNFVQRWVGWAAPLFNSENAPNESAERETIRDRANLTLGYTLLQNDQPHQAYRAFENIRTDGLDAQPALLGYGWAAAKKDELQIALAIWQRLMQLPQNSEYVLEAYLASAYAYEQAFAPRQSLAVLTQAIRRFEQSLLELDQASQHVNQRQFVLDLLVHLKPKAMHKQQQVASGIPVNALHLFDSVVVSNEFRAGLLALQQSVDIQQQLNIWQQQMLQYDLMLDEREAEQKHKAEQISQDRTLDKLSQLQAARDTLLAQLSSAVSQQDGQIFMPQQSQDWLTRVTEAQQRIIKINRLQKQTNQAPLETSYQQRLTRAKGRLIWQASEALPANQWQAQKALAKLDEQIRLAQTRQTQLLKLLADKPNFAQYRKRVSELTSNIDAQLANNTLLQDQLIGQLSSTFNQFILAHKQKVQNYLMQAQLAIVRLSDQALLKDNKGLNSTELTSPLVDSEGEQE